MNWYLLSLLAAILFTLTVLMEKRSLSSIHALQFSTETSFYGLILSFFLLPFVRLDFGFKVWGLLLIEGLIGTLSFYLFSRALRHSEVSEAAPLTNTDTIATLFFAVLILRELPGPAQLFGILLIFFGAYFLELAPKSAWLSPFRAFTRSSNLALMLAAMALYGLNRVIIKILLASVTPITLLFFAYLTFFFGYLILDLALHRENIVRLKNLLKVHGAGIFWTSLIFFAYRLVMTFAIAAGSVALVTAVSRTSTLFTSLAGGKLFRESALRQRLLACAIILIGVFLIVL